MTPLEKIVRLLTDKQLKYLIRVSIAAEQASRESAKTLRVVAARELAAREDAYLRERLIKGVTA